MDILVDSCVILDVFTRDPNWYAWSFANLTQYGSSDTLVINPLIYAEVSIRFAQQADLDQLLPTTLFRRDPLPWDAGFLAGKKFMAYKARGGQKSSPLPDFYIGAHAETSGMPLMTRDTNRYQTYFPTVNLIKP